MIYSPGPLLLLQEYEIIRREDNLDPNLERAVF